MTELSATAYPTGRKNCSRCGRWRPISDFGRKDKWLNSYCRACNRVAQRVTTGMKRRGKPYQPLKRHTTAGIPRVFDGRRQRLVWDSPEYREYRRFQDAQRREANGKPLKTRMPAHPPHRTGEPLHLPVGPFRRWLDELVEEIGVIQAGEATGLGQRRVYAKRTTDQFVHIDTVDKALQRVNGSHARGTTFLWDLYPDLYSQTT